MRVQVQFHWRNARESLVVREQLSWGIEGLGGQTSFGIWLKAVWMISWMLAIELGIQQRWSKIEIVVIARRPFSRDIMCFILSCSHLIVDLKIYISERVDVPNRRQHRARALHHGNFAPSGLTTQNSVSTSIVTVEDQVKDRICLASDCFGMLKHQSECTKDSGREIELADLSVTCRSIWATRGRKIAFLDIPH